MCKRWFYLMVAELNLELNFDITPRVGVHFAPAPESSGTVTNTPHDNSMVR